MLRKPFLCLSYLTALLLFALATPALRAQNITAGAIAGTVMDSTGAVIPKAVVTATSQSTGEAHSATSTASGAFSIDDLPAGDYTLLGSAPGFSQISIRGIHIDPGQRRGQDVKLAVGNVNTKVEVEADALAVQTESAESGGTITAKEVQNLMLNGRNFSELTSVLPGVSNTNGANGSYEAGQGAITSTVIVNGSSDEETMYTIDGIYNVTSASDITLPITPVIDDIDEMRVLSDNYSARYGLAGRQILVTTKSGGRAYHGSVYGYERSNEYGTAKPYLDTPAEGLSSLHLTDWGLTLGGPIKIPKLFSDNGKQKIFFFVGADWKANHAASTLNSRNTFTSAIRGGNLSSEPEAPNGAILTPYAALDPAHQAILNARYPVDPAACIFQEIPGGNYNGILPACMDPNTVTLMNDFWPLPNYTSTTANYINTNPTKFSVNDQLYRGDYNLNDRNTFTVRILHEESDSIEASRNYNDPAPNPGAIAYNPALNGLLRWQVNISPSLVNTASLAEVYTKYYSLPTGDYTLPSNVNIAQAFPTADPLNRIPDISLNNDTNSAENWFWLGVGAFPNYSKDGTGEFSDDLTWVKHNHTIQTGFTYMWNYLEVNASSFPMGNFCINGDYSGDTAGDYLLGFLANANNGCGFGYEQTNSQRAGVFRNKWTEAYVQDDWQVSPRLTLNLGLRWSYFTAPTMDGNQISNFVPSAFVAAQAPAISTTGAFTLNSQNQPLTSTGTVANLTNNGLLTACQGTPCGFTTPRKGLFAPRVGFAYRLTNDGKTSVHGGFGLGYTQVSLLQTSNLLSNIPFVQQPTYNSTEFSSPTGPAGSIANPPGVGALNATSSGYQPAAIRNYSLTFERQVDPGGIVSVGYAGSVTQRIFTGQYDMNFPNSGTSSGSAACAASSGLAGQPLSSWAYDPCINTGSVSSVYYRPYAGYAAITTGASLGVANYNGLLLGYVQKMKSLTAHVSYTFSKTLGDINASGVQVAYSSSGTFQNSHNPIGDYGRPDYDRPNVFVYSLVYEIPYFNSTSNRLEHTLLGGWQVSSFMTDESGFAQTPTFASGLATRPNTTGPIVRAHSTDGKPGQAPLYSYLNFTAPYYGYFGNAKVGSLRAPKEVAIHASVEKGFAIWESLSAKIGAQAFNILNHPNVLGINSTWSPTGQGSFGQATSYGDPREMQFYAKFTF
jgi:hypothetical protein